MQLASMAHSNPPEHDVGSRVPVLYLPDSPHEARIRSFTSLWLLAIVLGVPGSVFAALGIALLLGAISL